MKQSLTYKREELAASNSSTRSFRDILISAQSRRTILKGSLASAAVFLGSRSSIGQGISTRPDRAGLTDFRPVTRSQANRLTPYVSPDYRYQVILPWGEPIKPDGPAFEYPSNAADQESQIGIGHDGLWYFPDRDSVDLGTDVDCWSSITSSAQTCMYLGEVIQSHWRKSGYLNTPMVSRL